MTTIPFDYSTINMDKLNKLPVQASYNLQQGEGNGCYLNPPGHPSYFTKSVYTQHGNNPSWGTAMTLLGHALTEEQSWGYDLKKFYSPLPIDHPRVIAWMIALYNHQKNCYLHPTEQENGKPKIYIYPAPYYVLKSNNVGKDYNHELDWKKQSIIDRKIRRENAAINDNLASFCTPENHLAVKTIREYYPDHEPNLEWIENPPPRRGDWWERYAENFTPETCPGIHTMPHPATGHCQMCGQR